VKGCLFKSYFWI